MGQFPYLDFHDFHLLDLPAHLSSHSGVLAAEMARELSAVCFRIKGSDNAYTYSPQANTIDIIAGTEADTVVELNHESWQSLVNDQVSLQHLLCTGKIVTGSTEPVLFERWEVVLRVMLHDYPFT